MVTPQEQADLDVLLPAIQKIKLNCYEWMRSLDTATERELETSGFKGKTQAEAMKIAFEMAQRDIKKLHDAHLKKWPD